jgi:hypothetical protein
MTKLFLSAFAVTMFLASQSVSAAVPEDCWKSTAQNPGKFSVDIDTTNLTKDELMNELGQFSINTQVNVIEMPLFAPEQQYINMVIAPAGVTTTYDSHGKPIQESQAHIAARVNLEVQHLMSLPGVSIRCWVHAVPLPGVSLSN